MKYLGPILLLTALAVPVFAQVGEARFPEVGEANLREAFESNDANAQGQVVMQAIQYQTEKQLRELESTLVTRLKSLETAVGIKEGEEGHRISDLEQSKIDRDFWKSPLALLAGLAAVATAFAAWVGVWRARQISG